MYENIKMEKEKKEKDEKEIILDDDIYCEKHTRSHRIAPKSHKDCDREKTGESIPSYYLAVLLGFMFLFGYLTDVIENITPTPLTDREAGPGRFSEERAWADLELIVGAGPRVAGTPYHLHKTQDLKDMIDGIARTSRHQRILTDWQLVDGHIWLFLFTRSYINSFSRVSNVIAVLEGESGFNSDGSTNSSIVFNCHYDTVPYSAGASDNAVFCAVMVEALWILSQREQKLKHNIIFLFNGAEENGLQGVAGFLHHPWFKGTTAVVNLDSAGINGKSLVFQVSDPRVIEAYSRSVAQPCAQSLGEVLFTSGIIPSDTDFRIWRDFGNLYGIDVAFYKTGHVYHTRMDVMELLLPGVVQQTGDMVLSLMVEVGNSDHFYTRMEPQATVYYDYLNWFMITYNFTIATVVDTFISILSIGSIAYFLWTVGLRFLSFREMFYAVLGRLISLVCGIGCIWIIAGIMVATTIQLRYLSNSWIVVPIFWFPFYIGSVAAAQAFDSWRCNKAGLNRVRRMEQAMAATRAIITILVLVMLFFPELSTTRYVFTVPLLIMTVSSFISISVMKYLRLKAWQHVLLVFLLSVPSQMFLYMVAIRVNGLMLPIMGRSITLQPDLLVAALNMLLVAMASVPLSGIELLFSRIRIYLALLLTLVACMAVAFSPLSPYQGRSLQGTPVLQRHYWFHTESVTYNYLGDEVGRQSGVWFAHVEVNSGSFVRDFLNRQLRPALELGYDGRCERFVYCNMPMITPRTFEFLEHSYWIDLGPPAPPRPAPSLRGTRVCEGEGNVCTLHVVATGPHHMSFAIWPRPGSNLTQWSFNEAVTQTREQDGRPVFFVYHSAATYEAAPTPYTFTLHFTVQNLGEPFTDIAFTANRIYNPDEYTQEYSSLVQAAPEYFNIATYLSNRYNYEF